MRSQSSRPNLNLATWPFGLENGEYYSRVGDHSIPKSLYRSTHFENRGICLCRKLIFSTIYWMNVFISLKNLSNAQSKNSWLMTG
jgi:hypothetical protein